MCSILVSGIIDITAIVCSVLKFLKCHVYTWETLFLYFKRKHIRHFDTGIVPFEIGFASRGRFTGTSSGGLFRLSSLRFFLGDIVNLDNEAMEIEKKKVSY